MVKKVVSFVFAIILLITCILVNVLPALAYDVGSTVPIYLAGYLATGCSVSIVGDEHTESITGYTLLDDEVLRYNTSTYDVLYDTLGNPYLEVNVRTYTGATVTVQYTTDLENYTTVNVPASTTDGVDLPVGASRITININDNTSGYITDHLIWINLNSAAPPADTNGNLIIDFDIVDSSITNNYVLLYDGGRLSGDVTVNNKRLIVDLEACPPLENEEGLYYTLYLSNVPVGSYFVVRQPNDVVTGFGGQINYANESFLIPSNSLADYRFIVDYGTSNQIIDECEITIYFDSNIVDNYDAGYADGFKAGQLYGESIGFDKGYAKGLEDSEGGLVNSFVQLLTNPIIAIMSFQLAEINGTTITVGAIFYTILGIALVIAFIKLYAGG